MTILGLTRKYRNLARVYVRIPEHHSFNDEYEAVRWEMGIVREQLIAKIGTPATLNILGAILTEEALR